MDAQVFDWIRIAHIIGFVLWIGGLLSTLSLLKAHVEVDAASRPALTRIELATALIMDIGATLAIAAGLFLAFKSPKFPTTAFGNGGWLHVKLTIVVLTVLALHGMARAKIKKFKRGEIKPLPGWAVPVLLLAVAAIVTLGAHPTLLRK
jgi:putative membrane protein